jgi:hypothetical protein
VKLQSKAMAAIQDDEFVAVRSLIIPQQTIDSSAVPTVKETTVFIMHSLCFFFHSVGSLIASSSPHRRKHRRIWNTII